ncbi:hypothetical protein TNCV_3209561 [Trichonephila clavipes]|nr:hypothetical protein TNCV_3209561 [Trichonephila clavipes]
MYVNIQCRPSGIVTLTAVTYDLGSNPREGMNVCKCIVPMGQRRGYSNLVRLVEGEEMWAAPDSHQSVISQNWGRNEQNHTVTEIVLKVTDNDCRHLALYLDEFRGPRPGL